MYIINQQGSVFQVRNPANKPPINDKPPKRGKVEGFSAASRRRLIDFLNRMDDSYTRATFVTLTFSQDVSAQDAYAALKRFFAYVRYHYPEASGVWRKEPTKKDRIHFHIIFFNLPYWPQRELQRVWERCTGEAQSIPHIKRIR